MDLIKYQQSFDTTYLEPGFLQMLEEHLPVLLASNKLQALTLTEQQKGKYEGDLYGLLSEMMIPEQYHWVTMRLNGYYSSADYRGSPQAVYIPDYREVDLYKNVYNTLIR